MGWARLVRSVATGERVGGPRHESDEVDEDPEEDPLRAGHRGHPEAGGGRKGAAAVLGHLGSR